MRRHINIYPNICEIIKFRAVLRDDNNKVLKSTLIKFANDVYFGEMFT